MERILILAMMIDTWGRYGYTEEELVDVFRCHPDLQTRECLLIGPNRYNEAVKELYSDLELLNDFDVKPALCVDEWHTFNQNAWLMPEEYKNIDIENILYEMCKTEVEKERIALELKLYKEREAYDMLRYMKFLSDLIKKNNIIVGVGRGSSVASFVLYKLGLHNINSLEWNLDIKEFLK